MLQPPAVPSNGHQPNHEFELVSEAERILRERALQYAEAPEPSTPQLDVLLIDVGGRRYGLETRLLGPVQQARTLGAMPCAPPTVAGLLNVHGHVVTVLLGLMQAEWRNTLSGLARRVVDEGR